MTPQLHHITYVHQEHTSDGRVLLALVAENGERFAVSSDLAHYLGLDLPNMQGVPFVLMQDLVIRIGRQPMVGGEENLT